MGSFARSFQKEREALSHDISALFGTAEWVERWICDAALPARHEQASLVMASAPNKALYSQSQRPLERDHYASEDLKRPHGPDGAASGQPAGNGLVRPGSRQGSGSSPTAASARGGAAEGSPDYQGSICGVDGSQGAHKRQYLTSMHWIREGLCSQPSQFFVHLDFGLLHCDDRERELPVVLASQYLQSPWIMNDVCANPIRNQPGLLPVVARPFAQRAHRQADFLERQSSSPQGRHHSELK
jgi:hypothetical protein